MLTKKQLKERKSYIGGSDAGAIAGFSKYRSPLDVYRDKTDPEVEIDKPIYMHWGTILEPTIRKEFERIQNTKVSVIKDTKFHPAHSFLAANIDGRLENGELLEIKCCTFWGKKRYENNNFPLEYICQCAHYAAIYGSPVVHLAVFVGIDEPLRLFRYERDKIFEKKLLDKEINFWINNIKKEIPPEPRNYEEVVKEFNVKHDYSEELNTTVIATSDIEDAYLNLTYLDATQKKLEEKIKEDKALIMKYLGNNEILINRAGGQLCTWKFRESDRFDTKIFKKDKPDLYGKYLKHNSCRTFLITN